MMGKNVRRALIIEESLDEAPSLKTLELDCPFRRTIILLVLSA